MNKILPKDAAEGRTSEYECIRLLCKLVKQCILYFDVPIYLKHSFEGGCLPIKSEYHEYNKGNTFLQ